MARQQTLAAVRAMVAIPVVVCFCYAPVYAILLWLELVPGHLLSAPPGQVVFQMAFQGLGSVVIAGVTFTRMIQHFGPVRSTMMTSVVPALASISAVLVLGEPLSWNLAIGLALVTLGIVFGVRVGAAPGTGSVAMQVQSAKP